MSNKTNLSFFNAYIELDKTCAGRLGVKQNGVSSYINKLVEMRFAPNRSEVLPKLIKFRNYRKTMAHEVNAMRDSSEISKSDVKWIIRFTKQVARKADPVSKYERMSGFYSFFRKVRAVVIAAILAGGAFSIYYLLEYFQLI